MILNGIDVNEPESAYAYSGLGFELTAQAMSMITGLSAPRVYHQHLFEPLGFGDVIMGNGGSDGEFTAWELAVLAQMVCNRGSYGDIELFSEDTFERLLPQPLSVPGQGTTTEGIGLHWRLTGTDGYSANTVGHGSFSGCVFTIDLDRSLVIAQVRRNSGDRSGEWVNRFFRTISEVVVDTP